MRRLIVAAVCNRHAHFCMAWRMKSAATGRAFPSPRFAMKAALLLTFALLLAPVNAGTTEAESGVFEFDARDSAGTT
jgi:hypothetical protein